MASKVYFASLRARSRSESRTSKVGRLFTAAGLGDGIRTGDLTAVKIHFGEMGSDAFINPIYVREVVDRIKEAGGKPFITDSNTLYTGSRHNSVDHLETAIAHGFDYSVVRAPLIISDGLRGRNVCWVDINAKHFKKVRIAADIHNADSLIVMTHFKGHETAGFGGAIKNLGMGCGSAYGKMDQHSVRPKVDPVKCTGCGTCMRICPVDAHILEGGKVFIRDEVCIGCGECITVCPQEAIGLNWSSEIPPFLERIAEYAFGATRNKVGRMGFINFVTRVSPDCDCFPWSDNPIVPDVGILASKDPVALDAACYDLVNRQPGFRDSKLKGGWEAGEDKFRGMRPKVDGRIQLRHGEELGLGNLEYELVEI
ncbi:MAG: DUF362 domain-containing protein [Candidatus Thermoplasmatota archaeon]|nr:DUF362 domain-containing protein [Candidatus Thermoplasmatota archaeon]